MKYATYITRGVLTYGVLTGDYLYPMDAVLSDAPPDLIGFIESGIKLPSETEISARGVTPIPLNDVTLKAPIPYPRRDVICLGKNYQDHIDEIKSTALPGGGRPALPVYFGKRACPANDPEGVIPAHDGVTSQLDYEVELAVVIGKPCADIDEADAHKYIFGYTLINDVTARDVQKGHNQWYYGKGFAGCCPMGPVIADTAAMPDASNLNICSRVNGEPRQNGHTSQMIFTVPYVISQLSRGLRLLPGDIIATGTPAGVGHGFDPPKHLRRGDVVECEADVIGVLRNYVG